jgi:hypothetical protein
MKTVIIIFLFILIEFANTNQFEISPINFDIVGIETNKDTIINYGEFGSILVSYDNSSTWNQFNVFENGTIIKVFFEKGNILAFNDSGEIATSSNGGKQWEQQNSLHDTILAILKHNDGYFLRTYSKLISINNDFHLVSEFYLPSIPIPANIKSPYLYRNSMTCFQDYLLVEMDSLKLIRFTKNLIPVDTNEIFKSEIDPNFIWDFQIFANEEFIFMKTDDGIYRSSDLINYDRIYERSDKFYKYKYYFFKLINDKIFILDFSLTNGNPNSGIWKFIITQISRDKSEIVYPESIYNSMMILAPRDFTEVNNKIMISGNRKFLASYDLNNNFFEVLSDFSGHTGYLEPDIINDSTFLTYRAGLQNRLSNTIYKTNNKGLTFKQIVDTAINSEYLKDKYGFFKYFDQKDKNIYIIGCETIDGDDDISVHFSQDTGKSFQTKILPNFKIFRKNDEYWSNKLPYYPNIFFDRDTFLLVNNYLSQSHNYSQIYLYSKQFNLINVYNETNSVIDYIIESKNQNNFLVHCRNTTDKTTEIRFTKDFGDTWKIIKKYPYNELPLYYRELEINNKKYFAMVHFRIADSVCSINLLDIENLTVANIYEYRAKNIGNISYNWPENEQMNTQHIINNALTSDDGILYLAIDDTLFYTKEINNKESWKYYLFPNNGKVVMTFRKIGNYFYAYYSDGKHPMNLYWLNIVEPSSVIEINRAINGNSFFAYPPFPLPAKDYIKSLIYWDTSIDINDDEINVYDIYGNKVSGRENIIIDKQTKYSGILKWDCSGVADGIYLIHIKHGTKSWTLKVLVNK